jgi:hypothetical protein
MCSYLIQLLLLINVLYAAGQSTLSPALSRIAMIIQALKRRYTALRWKLEAARQRQPILRNDCVFVSIAHMLGINSAEEVLQKINWNSPIDPNGITRDEIREVLTALNCKYHW